MSQSTAQAPVPQPTPPPTSQSANQSINQAINQSGSRSAGRSQGLPEDVPKLLIRWQAIAVVACVLFGVVAAAFQILALQAGGRAADNTEQLVRVQQIQSSLYRADALATNAFLVGGLEPAAQRAEYDDAIDQVLRQIADAAEAQPADRAVLADLNTVVAAYVASNTQARDNNRQGFPVGAQYLSLAGASLRADAQPILGALVDANTERAEDEMGGQNTVPIFLTGLLTVAVLWWVNRQVARRFRRLFNVGLVGAAVVIGVVTLLVSGLSASRNNTNDDLRAGSFQVAIDESAARTAANDAKSRESGRLIARGSGATTEPLWSAAAAIVSDNASRETLDLWNAYVASHGEVVLLDDEGDWDGAVELATETGEGSTSAALSAFDQASQVVVANAAATTTDSLRSGREIAIALVVLSLLVGLGSAGAATWGVAQRRKEYA